MRNEKGAKGNGMIVIADDITGAAEIAGIAFSQGQQVQFVCGSPVDCGIVAVNGIIVIATDTRSMTETEAIAETRRIASQISNLKPQTSSPRPQIFKKTDSALRGHVVPELSALMAATGYHRTVYIPANPSKGRIVSKGIYYINGTPLAETDFCRDPEFPSKTSVMKERFPDAERYNILMPDAESEDDIHRLISEYNDGHTLFAGAADLFRSLIPAPSPNEREALTCIPDFVKAMGEGAEMKSLILCGSTQSVPMDIGIPISPMPREVYDGNEEISLWDTSEYAEARGLILTIPYTHRTGKAAAVHLRTMMATKAKALISQQLPSHLVIEGGATAWATLQALGWTFFKVVRQIAPGVVQLRSDCGTLITLKPGSYPWEPESILRRPHC